MNMKELWNSQADHQNQWDSLGEDEKLEFAMAHEREECAKVCQELLERPSGYQGRWEGYGKFKTQMTGQECADAIRARSKA
jgi:hypothetical protein